MTTHSSIRATVDADGNETAQALSGNVGGVISSADFETPGVTVQRGIGSHTVQTADQVQDTDIVEIDGMTMQAGMARDMGLLGSLFGDAPTQPTPSAAEAEASPLQKSDTGYAEFDAVVDGLSEAVEGGSMQASEAREYEAVTGSFAMTGKALDDVVETLDGLRSGALDPNEIDSSTRAELERAEGAVTATATRSAHAELGSDAFEWLSSAAATDPNVADFIRGYAIDRARGRHEGVTWADIYNEVASAHR